MHSRTTAVAARTRRAYIVFAHHAARRAASGVASDPAPAAADRRASAKLFADAAHEEASSPPRAHAPPRGAFAGPDEPWTGDERVQDAVLRMLVDKHKPLRGDFVSADERLRRAPPAVAVREAPPVEDDDLGEAAPLTAHLARARTSVAPGSASSAPPPPSGALADVPLLPSIDGHRPWHTTYVPPKHAASIKLGRVLPPSSPALLKPGPDGQVQRRDVQTLRRRMQAVRLTSAREGTLDYKLGLRREAGIPSRGGGGGGGPPSLRAWNSLVEERIEVPALSRPFACMYADSKPRKRGATASSRPSRAAAHRSRARRGRTTRSSRARSSS
jgi:DnaJ family protein C protein 28